MNEIQFLANLGLAVFFGSLIGVERQWRQRTAGIRTNALVSAGSVSITAGIESGHPNSSRVERVISRIRIERGVTGMSWALAEQGEAA